MAMSQKQLKDMYHELTELRRVTRVAHAIAASALSITGDHFNRFDDLLRSECERDMLHIFEACKQLKKSIDAARKYEREAEVWVFP